MTENKRFILEKDYDCEGNWEYCYQDNETGRRFNFADENCEIDFLNLVNNVINNLKNENKQLKKDRFICLDCEHSGYTEIGCLCEKEDCWTEYKSDCENFKELEE